MRLDRLGLLFLVSLLPGIVLADATLSVPATTSAGTGLDVVLPISISSGSGATSVAVVLHYDPAVLAPAGLYRTGLTQSFALTSSPGSPGTLGLSLSGGAPLAVSGQIARVVFHAIGSASSFSDVHWVLASVNGGAVPVLTQDGRINVISAASVVGSPDAAKQPGSTVTIPISASPADGATAFDLGVRFNQAVLSPASVAKTALTSAMTLTTNTGVPGDVKISLFGTIPITGSGAIVNITYNVVGAIGDGTPLDVYRGDINERAITSVLDDALFAVCNLGDGDGDGFAGCAGDCDDSNPAIHPGATEVCNGLDDDCDRIVDNHVAAPSGKPSASIAKAPGASRLSWTAVAGSTGYDVVRGDLGTLVASAGNFTAATGSCLANDAAATTLDDPGNPAGGFFYVVRAVSCGGAGSYDSTGTHQQGSRDGEIAAAAGACP